MHPNISDLLRHNFYPHLVDDPSTSSRPEIKQYLQWQKLPFEEIGASAVGCHSMIEHPQYDGASRIPIGTEQTAGNCSNTTSTMQQSPCTLCITSSP
jgi:hypothetical protein